VDTTGESFPAFIHSTVLDPLHISHSTYEQPLPIPLQSDSAAGALSDGAEVPGKWHINPEMISEGSFIADRAIALLAVRCA
jgi:CubicO group peptidase (beta-lactamase class C family)